MCKLTQKEKDYLTGYANALQDLMFRITGENTNGKSYDPIEFCDTHIHSYAFDFKDGGRHHPLSDYKDAHEIAECMLNEAEKFIKD